ncbi:transcriptional regulator swi6 [Blyttiomyces sp. JEL0837]|nr:transcriptional regulator swi6 [Blyttiomyces sp. JEL0837]
MTPQIPPESPLDTQPGSQSLASNKSTSINTVVVDMASNSSTLSNQQPIPPPEMFAVAPSTGSSSGSPQAQMMRSPWGEGARKFVNLNHQLLMQRKADSYVNATHILKLAKVEKGKRAAILSNLKVKLGDNCDSIQGGYGKYQGTW